MAGASGQGDPERLQMRLKDGRAFGLATYGDPRGLPVLALHGAPASRLMFDVADQAARGAGLKLYCPDRPGYGLTPPDAQPSLASRAQLIEAIADHLGLERLALLGVSGGAPYAVALANRLGPRVAAMALVSPMGPIADMAAADSAAVVRDIPKGQRWFFMQLPKRRAGLRALAAAAARGFHAGPTLAARGFARLLSPADTEILSRPEYEASLIRMTREALRQGSGGGVADLRIYSQPWGVDFAAVRTPAVLWQGTADRIVPRAAALWLGKALPQCQVEEIAGAGHFWVYANTARILRRLAQLAAAKG